MVLCLWSELERQRETIDPAARVTALEDWQDASRAVVPAAYFAVTVDTVPMSLHLSHHLSTPSRNATLKPYRKFRPTLCSI